ncbi:DUF2264 domain-containing protein [uncultured Paludibaculum sp.]|uniref:DUF2264 domain-containing protein n=1 Tax=uncultured Paludibaculum sp. TaxID=1765020 RepID=UPI002AAB09D9|nr:DUF2264 domain-containing protein [uncultured Paludibaculum sp.]
MECPLNGGLRSRDDVAAWCLQLLGAVEACLSPAGARLRNAPVAANYSAAVAGMEGCTRPLWAVSALLRGGFAYAGWTRFAEGIANGTDPKHPEFWVYPGDCDQRLVEICPVAAAICLAPQYFWRPFSDRQQNHVVAWLQAAAARRYHDNNWLFFRVMVAMALESVGARAQTSQVDADLDRIESFHVRAGWYSDGPDGVVDYYNSHALHYYGLLYAWLFGERDRARAARFKERAAQFSESFQYWFAPDGAAVPFGRSLTYRFAEAAFWSSAALCGCVDYGLAKGILLRSLRRWRSLPIFSDSGLLTLGYGYPNLNMTEQYNSPASPYWAMKSFLPLALPATHDFWTAPEAPLPDASPKERHPAKCMVSCRSGSHIFLLTGGEKRLPPFRHAAEKYAKFAYSSAFAFNIPTASRGLSAAAIDSMLAVSADSQTFNVRGESRWMEMRGDEIFCGWSPLAGVDVVTALIASPPWHVRIHVLATSIKVLAVEGGFAVEYDPEGPPEALAGAGTVLSAAGLSWIRDLNGNRKSVNIVMDPNGNLNFGHSAVPALVGVCGPGRHVFACAVAAWPVCDRPTSIPTAPRFECADDAFTLRSADGSVTLAQGTMVAIPR